MNGLTCGSLFSGVGGMDLGILWAGYEHRFFAEIDPFARAVLAERFPGVPIYEDVRDVPECGSGIPWGVTRKRERLEDDGGLRGAVPRGNGSPDGDCEPDERSDSVPRTRLDVLTFGSPCQDLSVAGKRRGLDGDRSGLFWEAMRIAGDGPLRPRALLMENVEGLLSSNNGRDFALVLDAMAERGYRWSYRVLDSQHFGVPQRRRRVFVLAIADGDPGAERIGEVLAVSEGGDWDSPASDPAWPEPPSATRGGAEGGGGRVVGALTGRSASRLDEQCVGGGQLVAPHDLVRTGKNAEVVKRESDATYYIKDVERGPVKAGGAGGGPPRSDRLPLMTYNVRPEYGNGADLRVDEAEIHPTLAQQTHLPGYDRGIRVQEQATVRRITPLECERLMGWPDGWTDVPWNGKDHAPDSRRYAACGNGVVAPVAFWIGARLAEVLGGD